jgi:hypothetical protein
VPLVLIAALLTARSHQGAPRVITRSPRCSPRRFVLYVELRKRWFPSPLPAELKEDLRSMLHV